MSGHNLDRVWRYAAGQPWAILPSKAAEILAVLEQRGRSVPDAHTTMTEFRLNAIAGTLEAQAARAARQRRGVALIPVVGTIGHRMNLMTAFSGGVSTDHLRSAVRAAVRDPEVSTLVLDVDSPGGGVADVPELAADIAAASKEKRVVAVANDLMASAAYWIASGASEIVVTPSGQVGSIGVVALHEEWSAFDEALGVKTTLVSAGEGKVDGNVFEPLSARAKADIEAKVETYYSQFVRAVADGRRVAQKTVREVWQATMQTAEDAVKLGLADRVATLDETLDRLGVSRQTATRAEVSDDEARLRAGRRARASVDRSAPVGVA